MVSCEVRSEATNEAAIVFELGVCAIRNDEHCVVVCKRMGDCVCNYYNVPWRAMLGTSQRCCHPPLYIHCPHVTECSTTTIHTSSLRAPSGPAGTAACATATRPRGQRTQGGPISARRVARTARCAVCASPPTAFAQGQLRVSGGAGEGRTGGGGGKWR